MLLVSYITMLVINKIKKKKNNKFIFSLLVDIPYKYYIHAKIT